MLAPQALNFNTAGPLNPQWVTSTGPSDNRIGSSLDKLFSSSSSIGLEKRFLGNTSSAAWVLTPWIPFNLSSFILKVNKEGVGGTIWWPILYRPVGRRSSPYGRCQWDQPWLSSWHHLRERRCEHFETEGIDDCVSSILSEWCLKRDNNTNAYDSASVGCIMFLVIPLGQMREQCWRIQMMKK